MLRAEIRAALEDVRQAKARYHKAIAEAISEGSWLHHDKGRHNVRVRVLKVRGECLFVLNPLTNKQYWIDAYHVL